MAMAYSQPLSQRSRLLGGYIRLLDTLSRISAYLASIMFVAGVMVICQMVFTRYVLGMSTSWQTEFTVFSVTSAMLLGSPYVLMTGGHVAITILPDALGGVWRKIMRFVAALCGLAFCVALAFASWVYLIEAYQFNWRTGTVWNPLLWPGLLPMALGTSLLALQYTAEILRGEE